MYFQIIDYIGTGLLAISVILMFINPKNIILKEKIKYFGSFLYLVSCLIIALVSAFKNDLSDCILFLFFSFLGFIGVKLFRYSKNEK